MSHACVLRYIQTYYASSIRVNTDFLFQEMMRTKSALEFNNPDNQQQPGRMGLQDIQTFAPMFELSKEFKAFIDDILKSTDTSQKNLRGALKQIWTWPQTQYLPWNKYESKEVSMLSVANLMNEIQSLTKIELVGGKLYLNMTGFRNSIWSQIEKDVRAHLQSPCLQQNSEIEHVTLVNSDVISKLEAKKVDEFVEYAQTVWSASGKWSPKEFRHTISLDWAPFSICVVLHIESTTLIQLMQEFDKRFGTVIAKKLESGLHTTLGVHSRM